MRASGRIRRRVPKSVATGLGVGLLTGLFGVDSGFLIIPALVLCSRRAVHDSAAESPQSLAVAAGAPTG